MLDLLSTLLLLFEYIVLAKVSSLISTGGINLPLQKLGTVLVNSDNPRNNLPRAPRRFDPIKVGYAKTKWTTHAAVPDVLKVCDPCHEINMIFR